MIKTFALRDTCTTFAPNKNFSISNFELGKDLGLSESTDFTVLPINSLDSPILIVSTSGSSGIYYSILLDMSESLKSILRRRDSGEPEESAAIKQFVLERFNSPCKVILSKSQIVIVVSNSALAGTLRMHLIEISKLIKSKRKLIIRIG